MARMTSGAIQYGVPTNELAGHTMEAEPKSAVKQWYAMIQYNTNTAT